MTPRHRADAIAWVKKNQRHLRLLTEPPLQPPSKLEKEELLRQLRLLRDGWEALTSRNQDLSDERLAAEPRATLNHHYAWFRSEEGRALLADVLGQLVIALVKESASHARGAVPGRLR